MYYTESLISPVSDCIPILIQHSGTPRSWGVGVCAFGVPLTLVDEGELTNIPTCCGAERWYPQVYSPRLVDHLFLGEAQTGQEQQQKS